MSKEETLKGEVESIIFANKENAYTVFSIKCENEEMVCVGHLPYLTEGERVELIGSYTMHPVYGRQFIVTAFEKLAPSTLEGMEKYLGSGIIKGVGVKTAKKIVEEFGNLTFMVIENHHEKLADITGITPKKAKEISILFHEQNSMRTAIMFLQDHGITPAMAMRIYKFYKDKTIDIVKTNPYELANNIDGIGFKIADNIAMKQGVTMDNPNRVKAGIRYLLSNCVLNGHVYLPMDELVRESSMLLDVGENLVEQTLKELHIDNYIVMENVDDTVAVYYNSYYYAESYVAKKLLQLNVEQFGNKGSNSDLVEKTCNKLNLDLASNQREALIQSAKGGVLVITGGPGTGKTTTINAIINLLKMKDCEIELAAPTGRAAKRMSETTKMEAKTIHRLLEVKYIAEDKRRQGFEKNEENPIVADVVIIDEISMVDIMLMYSLLKAIAVGTSLIMVGDADQLPSVGPGNVLKDIISSKAINCVFLDEIFRQSSLSDIVVNAHNINKGIYPVLNGNSKDFFMVKRENIDNVSSTIVDLIKERLPKFGNYCPIQDMQVLSPMRKSKIGVASLNNDLQNALNPKRPNKNEYEFRNIVFREGDKVMQIKNNYNMKWLQHIKNSHYKEEGQGIFNGDEGIIKSINNVSETVTVLFDDGKQVDYDFTQLEEVELAYAITIHKSQGSEYKVIIIPVHSGPPMLLNRNLLYTGVTRAREMVVLVGTQNCLHSMIDNKREIMRYSTLDKKLEKFGKFYEIEQEEIEDIRDE